MAWIYYGIFLVLVVILVVVIVLLMKKMDNKELSRRKLRMEFYRTSDFRDEYLVQSVGSEDDCVGVSDYIQKLVLKADKIVTKFDNDLLTEKWELLKKNPEGITETLVGDKLHGYTVNKGECIRIRVRGMTSGGEDSIFLDESEVLYVLIHELAHIITDSYGHTEEFKDNFRKLLKCAKEMGLKTSKC